MYEVIYKYGPLFAHKTVEYEGTPVHVGIQDDEIYMWCKVYPPGTGRFVENPDFKEDDGSGKNLVFEVKL